MWKASVGEDYERASKLRDDIRSLEATALKQRIAFLGQKERDKDIITVARGPAAVEEDAPEIAAAIVFQVRDGNVIGREKFILDGVSSATSDEEILSAFIKQHYSSLETRVGKQLPHDIVIPMELPDSAEVKSLLVSLADQPIKGDNSGEGFPGATPSGIELSLSSSSEENKRLMKLAQDNAQLVLKEHESKEDIRKRERLRSLKDLKEKLELDHVPRRIECFDISNIHGDEAVGAMTVFIDGFPDKGEYRKFRIKTVKGIDDYSMMAEMIGRRFRRLTEEGAPDRDAKKETRPWAREPPDLVIIDGGKGHLNAAINQMRSDGILGIPTVALAKKEELIFTPNRMRPIKLAKDSEALHIMQHIRDQAHHFGITYHRNLRSKKITRSKLDEIAGIGEKRKRNLLAHFGSIEAIKRSSPEEIAQVAKISQSLAIEIARTLDN